MIQLFAMPFIAATLMSMAWIATLGGSRLIIVSGLLLGLVTFWLNVRARLVEG